MACICRVNAPEAAKEFCQLIGLDRPGWLIVGWFVIFGTARQVAVAGKQIDRLGKAPDGVLKNLNSFGIDQDDVVLCFVIPLQILQLDLDLIDPVNQLPHWVASRFFV